MNENETSLVKLSRDNQVLVLSLNRPEKMNALNSEMYICLNQQLERAAISEDIGAVLICAEGDHFTAGNDIADFMQAAAVPNLNYKELPVVGFIFQLLDFPKPIVAAVQGQAVGIGLTMNLHVDYVVAAETALFSAPFVNLGLVPEAGSSILLPQRVGALQANEILMMGETIAADKAWDWGLVNEVVSPDNLRQTATSVAKKLASKPAEAQRLTKELLHADREIIRAQMDKELSLFFQRLSSDEAKEAFAAFMGG